MAGRNIDQSVRGDMGKVGSDPEAAKKVGGRGDFGVPADNVAGREYASHETKQNDPGADHDRMRSGDSAREAGVGSNATGRGAGSGGDLDTDFVGLGGSGLSQSGPDERTEGADMTTTGGSDAFAAAGPKGHSNHEPRIKGVAGTTIDRSGGDATTTGALGSGGTADANLEEGDDARAGEISVGEADGSIERE